MVSGFVPRARASRSASSCSGMAEPSARPPCAAAGRPAARPCARPGSAPRQRRRPGPPRGLPRPACPTRLPSAGRLARSRATSPQRLGVGQDQDQSGALVGRRQVAMQHVSSCSAVDGRCDPFFHLERQLARGAGVERRCRHQQPVTRSQRGGNRFGDGCGVGRVAAAPAAAMGSSAACRAAQRPAPRRPAAATGSPPCGTSSGPAPRSG